MSEPSVDLFVEDQAHEQFIRAMTRRVLTEQGHRPKIRVRSARGGHGRVMQELGLYQKSVRASSAELRPELLVAAVDCNCKRFTATSTALAEGIDQGLFPRIVLACPDPHIERWFMADPASFQTVVGRQPPSVKRKCERDRYKKLLVKTLEDEGHAVTMGGIEFAPDLVAAMDLFRAGRNAADLKHFLDSLRSAGASLAQSGKRTENAKP